MLRQFRIALVIATLIVGWLTPNAALASSTPPHHRTPPQHHKVHRTCPPPSAPPQVSANPGANQAVVTWQAASGNGSQLTAYVVTAFHASSPSTSVATDGNTLAATVYGLAGGASYTFQVYAQSSCGSGPAASSKSVTPSGASTTYATTVEADAPVAYYRLSELSGNTAADSSGNSALGAYGSGAGLGVPGAVLGDPDTAVSWNGSCCGLLTSSPNLAFYNYSRSIEAWVKTTDTNFRYLAGYGQGGQDQAFNVGIGPNQVGLTTNYDDRYWAAHTLNDGNWHYIVITYDGKNATAYVDGQSLGAQQYTSGLNTLPDTLNVGSGDNGNGNPFVGSLGCLAK